MCFFFNDTATTEIYTLSLHDALPISQGTHCVSELSADSHPSFRKHCGDRKSTRLNSSHRCISYAVFCLKTRETQPTPRCGWMSLRVTQSHGHRSGSTS